MFPLAVYETAEERDYQKWYAYGKQYAICYPYKRIPAFQLIVSETGTFENAILTRVSDGWTDDITTEMNETHITKITGLPGDYAIIKNFPSEDLDEQQGIPWLTGVPGYGLMELQFDYNGQTYYTDRFVWCEDVSDKIKLTYKHEEHFPIANGLIHYDGDYENTLYIDAEVAKPLPLSNEDVEEREGYYFPFQMVSWLQYRFTWHGPDFIVQALRMVWMHDIKTIEYKGITYNVDRIRFDPKWDEYGHIAQIECEFTTDTVVAITGRAIGNSDTYDLPPIPTPDQETGGAFSNGFSNGFLIE